MELVDENIASRFILKSDSFELYSQALDDPAQLPIFLLGIDDSFVITEEFVTMESLKGTTQ